MTLEGLPFPTRNDVEVQMFDGLACCPAARLHDNYTIRLQRLARRVRYLLNDNYKPLQRCSTNI